MSQTPWTPLPVAARERRRRVEGLRFNSLAAAALRSQPDGRLASLARNGYSQGFEEIARRYRASLVHFAGSIVPAHRAEDVVQDALVKAYRSLPKSDQDLNLRPWLYQIVRNTALNDLRDERVHDHLDENWDGVRQPPDVAAHPRQARRPRGTDP